MPTSVGLALLAVVADLDGDVLGALDHVCVGEDVALVVEDEARAGRLARLDEGDPTGVALVDLADREALAIGAAVVADELGLGRGCRRRWVRAGVVADPAGLDGPEADRCDDEAAGDGRPEGRGESVLEALHRSGQCGTAPSIRRKKPLSPR